MSTCLRLKATSFPGCVRRPTCSRRIGKMLDKSAQAGQHSYQMRGRDCYETPPEAVTALLRVEKLPEYVWEPACGPGAIVKVLRKRGHTVIASDVIDYGWEHSVTDFLTSDSTRQLSIVTNPPYKLAQRFVEKAIKLRAPVVVMLLRLAFLESERRRRILEFSGLARVHVFRNRLPMMHRRDWDGPK